MKPDSNLTSRGGLQPEADPGNEILRRIANAISGVRFGSVEVVIQDSRVVQIERKEKFRFDKTGRG
ncbi:YezD family protein [Candidatus Binatus sp.]|uniref:YezD family protein n=1 Tax=Candidatus Binatus sp. TaxID=2811406 RepID=UPI003BB04AB6